MPRFYEPDLGANPDSPFARDASGKLIRRSYWLDMTDRTLVMVMVNGIGADLTNDEKRAHLIDLKRDHLIDQVCVQEFRRRKDKFVSFRADRSQADWEYLPRQKGDHPARSWGPPGGRSTFQQKGGYPAGCRGALVTLSGVGGPGVDSRHHSAW